MVFTPALSIRDPDAPRAWLVVTPTGLLADGATPLLEDAQARSLGLSLEDAHALGQLDGREVLVAAHDGPLPDGMTPQSLRALAALLDGPLFAAAGRALHVVDWATNHRFCGHCGAPTLRQSEERAMACTQCSRIYYPRIAPAIIVLVRKGRQALLAQNARFPGRFYSTLAGFSEIGESLEETLVREVREEVGVEVASPRYFGSQPWPFPNSLMLGFVAEWESGEIVIDPREIADARWFDADALPDVPPPLSIARKLIDAWVREVRG